MPQDARPPTAAFPAAALQRARGSARVALDPRAGGGVRLGDIYQQGSARAFLPPAWGATPRWCS